MVITQPEYLKKKKTQFFLSENNLRALWCNVKHTNIHIIRVPEKREKGIKNVFEEIMTKKIPPNQEGNRYAGMGITEGPKKDELRPTSRHNRFKIARETKF